jgi:fatty-acyl-CoA synthase
VISVILPNVLEFYYVYWGGEAAGIVNPLNYMLEPSSIVNLCIAAKTKVLVVPGEETGDIGADIWRKIRAVRKDLTGLKAIVTIGGPGDEKNLIYGYEETINRFQGERLDSGRVIDRDDTSSMLYTGGTTGTPKLAIRSHFNEVSIPFITNLYNQTLHPGEVVFACTPLFHTLGPVAEGTFAFSVGGHVLVLTHIGLRDSAIVKNIYKIIDHYKAVCSFLVPTILYTLIDTPVNDADISSFRWVSIGGSPLSKEIIYKWESKTSAKILQCYGLTEATAFTSMDPLDGERRVGSTGLRLPYLQQRVFVLDENGAIVREAEQQEIGTICIKGPTIMKGYMDPDHNKRAFAKEGWLNTGDLARQDADGYFWLTGRSKELIRRSGHNIDPAVIEHPLYKLEGIHLVAAVAKPDSYAGEVVSLYVQLKPGHNVTKEDIMDYLKQHIGERAAIPKEIIFIDSMPLTTVGKIFKPALHWDTVRRTLEGELSVLRDEVELCSVSVGEDKAVGTLATVTAKANAGTEREHVEKRIREILAPYAVRYRVEML